LDIYSYAKSNTSIRDIIGLREEMVSDYPKFYRDLVGNSFDDENDKPAVQIQQ
jgi:hypothetical protein